MMLVKTGGNEFDDENEDDEEEVCQYCGGTGEVTVMEQVYPGEPHVAPIGTRPCICQLKDDEE